MRAGSHHSDAAQARMAITHLVIRQIPWNKGRKMADNSRDKMSAAKKGKPGHPHGLEAKEKIKAAMLGKKHALGCVRSEKTRSKMGGFMRGRRGALSPFWKGGRRRMKQGYVRVFVPGHPHADPKGYVFEHRLIVEKAIGRYLKPSEKVHHDNERKDDNHNGNLVACQDEGYHGLLHTRARRLRIRKCRSCGCTEARACPGGCYWVEADLCSACIGKDEERKRMFAKSGGDWIKPIPTAGEMFDAVDKEARRRGGQLLKKDDDTKTWPGPPATA